MELVRWEPFMNFGNLHSVFNDWFDSDVDCSSAQPRTSIGYLVWHVLEGKDAYLIRAELPGMKRNRHIELKGWELGAQWRTESGRAC